MAKSRKRPAKSNEKSKNLADNDDIDVVPEVEDDGESEESSDDDEMEEEEEEKIDFDFEALPPHESDLEGLVDLITQVKSALWRNIFLIYRFFFELQA